MCDNTLEEFDEVETDKQAAKAQIEQAAQWMAQRMAQPPVHPFVEILDHVPAEQRVGLYAMLLRAAAEQLANATMEKALLQTKINEVNATAAERSCLDQKEGFTRAVASVRASLTQWPEGACDQEVARLVSLIVHKAITDDAGALWVSAGMPPSRDYIGEEFLVALLMGAPGSTPRYQRRMAVWHGDQGWVAAEDGRTRLHPAYWHHMPKGPRPEAPRHIAVEPQS